MRRSIVFLAAVTILFPVANSLAEIVVERNRFNGQTRAATKFVSHKRGVPFLALGFTSLEEKPAEPGFHYIVHYVDKSWTYLSCHSTYWLADGVPVLLPQPEHRGTVGNGFVLEQLLITSTDISHFQQLAQAKTVEYKICNDEYKATASEMKDFRTLLSYLQKVQRGESIGGK